MSDLLLLAPFLLLIVLNLLPKGAQAASLTACVVLLVAQIFVATLHPFGLFDWSFLSPLEKALGFNLAVDNLGILLLVCAGIAGMAALLTGRHVIRKVEERFRFTNLLLIALIGINGIAVVRDFFTLYVFIEVTAVATFILVALRNGSHAFEGAWKYIILSAVASFLMLSAIAFFLLSAGDVSFAAVVNTLPSNNSLSWIAIVLYMSGLFVKGALVPFHGWLADAYTAAPPPVSILMAGIVTKASGIFALIRLAAMVVGQDGPMHAMFLAVGTLTIVAGAFLALGQSDIKRMLAYSSISQMGYVVLSLGGDPSLGVAAAAVHFFTHTLSNAQLFGNAAALEERLGTRDMNAMGGISARMPVTGWTAVVACLSIAGLPPLAGFWSKLLIVIALWRAGRHAFAAIAVLMSLVTLAYFLSMQRKVFFGTTPPEWRGVREAGALLAVPTLVLALLTVIVGLGFPFFLSALMGGGA